MVRFDVPNLIITAGINGISEGVALQIPNLPHIFMPSAVFAYIGLALYGPSMLLLPTRLLSRMPPSQQQQQTARRG
jgi:hypothetical protein